MTQLPKNRTCPGRDRIEYRRQSGHGAPPGVRCWDGCHGRAPWRTRSCGGWEQWSKPSSWPGPRPCRGRGERHQAHRAQRHASSVLSFEPEAAPDHDGARRRLLSCWWGRPSSTPAFSSPAGSSPLSWRRLDLGGKRVADIGTGSGHHGVGRCAGGSRERRRARHQPERRTQRARECGHQRTRRPGRRRCAQISCPALGPRAQFDVILSNPPYFPEEPLDLADRAWNAGPGYRDIAPLFEQARATLTPGGSDVSSDIVGSPTWSCSAR